MAIQGDHVQVAEHELVAGLVAYLDQALLISHPHVLTTLRSRVTKIRPFVCLGVDGDLCCWTPFTSKWRKERLMISASWRLGGQAAWVGSRCYLHDGASVVLGPKTVFSAASLEDNSMPENRLRITPIGLSHILAEAEKQRERRLTGRALCIQPGSITGHALPRKLPVATGCVGDGEVDVIQRMGNVSSSG